MGEIKCKYVEGAKRKKEKDSNDSIVSPPSSDKPEISGLNRIQSPGDVIEQTTVLPDFTSNLNLTSYEMASIKLWPVINARFIRIRPWKWKKYVALRMELLGNDRPMDHQQIGKVVHLNTVSPLYKQEILSLLKDKDSSTPFIQIDCKTTIQKAMDLAGCTTYGMIETDKKHNLLVFTTPDSHTSECVMDRLTEVGVGINIGVISAVGIEWRNSAKKLEQIMPNSPADSAKPSGFYSNIKSHKAIQVVVTRIMNAAQMSFDNLCMLIIAALIAVAGLGIDSSVIVISSMLVSPLMGPVLALTFGYTLGNKPMRRMGFLNECYMLLICIFVGFVVGLFWSLITSNFYDWPTKEMTDRGEPMALFSGLLIAAASGVGVALSVLGDYLSTVVGVAISASLLPPAVNCGMLFAFSLYELTPQGDKESAHLHTSTDLFEMAGISLALTIENIIVIFLSAAAMFKIKDIVQIQDRNHERVWDNISHFKEQHRKLKRAQTRYQEQMDDDDDDTGYKPFPFGKSHIDAFNLDVHAKDGTNAAKAIAQIENTMTHEDMLAMQGAYGAKVGVLRQAKTIYNFTPDDNEEKVQNNQSTKPNRKNSGNGHGMITTGRNKKGYMNIRLSDENESSSDEDQEPVANGHSHPGVSTLFPGKSNKSQRIQINEESLDKVVSNDVVDEND